MNALKTKKQVEAVVWLQNLTEEDEVFLLQLELHHSLVGAKIKNLPLKYIKHGGNGLMQFYIPTAMWDKEWFEQICINELGNRYMQVVIGEE